MPLSLLIQPLLSGPDFGACSVGCKQAYQLDVAVGQGEEGEICHGCYHLEEPHLENAEWNLHSNKPAVRDGV